jgi:hypothetical protein
MRAQYWPSAARIAAVNPSRILNSQMGAKLSSKCGKTPGSGALGEDPPAHLCGR